jgi:hypothetical protein
MIVFVAAFYSPFLVVVLIFNVPPAFNVTGMTP